MNTISNPQISIEELQKLLISGPVRFKFTKKNGQLREAYGTLSKDLIPSKNQPKEEKSAPDIFPYYDLEVFYWRSIAKDQLIFV